MLGNGDPRRPIVALGEIVVEIVAEERGHGFLRPLRLVGPYPSGAPAIFTSQVARLGHPAALISCVGDDDFGRLNVERLRADGADVSAIGVDPSRPTGTAFVRYRPDGARDFVFNIRHSASAATVVGSAAEALLRGRAHLHVMGSSLFSDALVAAVTRAIDLVRAGGGTVSFDPNVRKEMLARAGMRDALSGLLGRCDVFLPSGDELTLLTRSETEDAALAELLDGGVAEVVVKRGAAGASYVSATERIDVEAYPADEVDPTGAGDCFGAAFVTCRVEGRSPEDSLRRAAASGALAVGEVGPMEGAATVTEIERVLARGRATGRDAS